MSGAVGCCSPDSEARSPDSKDAPWAALSGCQATASRRVKSAVLRSETPKSQLAATFCTAHREEHHLLVQTHPCPCSDGRCRPTSTSGGIGEETGTPPHPSSTPSPRSAGGRPALRVQQPRHASASEGGGVLLSQRGSGLSSGNHGSARLAASTSVTKPCPGEWVIITSTLAARAAS